MKSLIKSILAGVAVGMGGIVYLSLENQIVGSFLFAIGLFTIYTFDFELYTGKICYIPNKAFGYLKYILLVFTGNTIGTVFMGYLMRGTKQAKLIDHVEEVVALKLSDTVYSTFIMAIFCGILMSVAVLGYKTIKDSMGKNLALILPIMVFILSGYEHSIANLFYFSFGNAWNSKAVLYIAIVAIGNLIGGAFIPFIIKVLDHEAIGCDQ